MSEPGRDVERTRRGRRWLILPAVVLGLPLLAWLGVLLASHSWAQAARRDWTARGPSLVDWFPAREANDAALAVEQAAARVGVPLTPGRADRSAAPWRDRATIEDAYAHVRSRLQRGGVAPPAPPGVEAWLSDDRDALDALEAAVLESGQAPLWERDLTEIRTDHEHLFARLRLNAVLVLRGLERARAGEPELAWRSLRAAWTLLADLEDRPGIVPRRVGNAGLQLLLRAARRVPGPPPVWADALVSIDAWAPVRTEAEHEAWRGLLIAESDAPLTQANSQNVAPGWKRGLATIVVRPALRAMAADTATRLLAVVDEAEAAGPCTVDFQALARRAASAVPAWNVAGRMAMDSLVPAWKDWLTLEMERALTRRVLAVRRSLAGGPPSASTDEELSACEGLEWQLTSLPGGGFRLAYTGNVAEARFAPDAPISFETSPPGAPSE